MARVQIGAKIREKRKQLGVTQADLAGRLGISASYLNLIERNKRNVSPRMFASLSEELGVDREWLDGRAERRLVEEMMALSADPLLASLDLNESSAGDIVTRAPAWGQALVALYRAYLNRNQTVTALSDRLNQDPYLGAAVHEMLTKITAIRSTSEILDTEPDIDAAQRRRFQRIVAEQSAGLSAIAEGIAQFFDTADTDPAAMTPMEEADDFIVDNGNYFPDLEDAVDRLRPEIDANGVPDESRLREFLRNTYGTVVRFVAAGEVIGLINQVRFDADANTLYIEDSAALPRIRFRMARLACAFALSEQIDQLAASSPHLRSADGIERGKSALISYAAAALLMPYDAFFASAERNRYDIEYLTRRFVASFEQVCHRLVTLKKPGAAGIPFAFMRADQAGFITKRMPLPHLAMPRYGNACPIWGVYSAFQMPGQLIRQIAEFPNGERFMFIAQAQDKAPSFYNQRRHLVSVMIACDALYADRTVYADGWDLGSKRLSEPVGPGCRICVRRDCAYREEPQIQQLAIAAA